MSERGLHQIEDDLSDTLVIPITQSGTTTDTNRAVAMAKAQGFPTFDLEVLALAARLGYTIAEVPIRWREVPGGHLHPVMDLPRIMVDLWRLRRRLQATLRER